MKILIADDEPSICMTLRFSLGKLGGWDVIEAANGVQAVALAQVEKPDLILLDVMMPEMDGEATFAALKQSPLTAGIPVVFLTAKALPSQLAQLRASGALGVLTKPFDPIKIADEIRALMG